MSEYTPDTGEVREQYWAANGQPRRDSLAWGEFDRWLRKVQAKAWEEGWTAHVMYCPGDYGKELNPYREDAS